MPCFTIAFDYQFVGIENLPKRVQMMDADVDAIKALIAAECAD